MAQRDEPQMQARMDAAAAIGHDLIGDAMRAVKARYDRDSGRVTIELADGCAFAFPASLIHDLRGASQDQLASVELAAQGSTLRWAKADASLYLPAFLASLWGIGALPARELARRAGKVTSPAKKAAARANGAKGGRPRKNPDP